MTERRGGTKILKVGTLNVRGVNKEEKREEVGIVMKEKGFDVLALTETKLKGKGEISFGMCNVNVKKSDHSIYRYFEIPINSKYCISKTNSYNLQYFE